MKTGAQPVRLNGIVDARQVADEMQLLKAEHRRRIGLTRDELQKMAGGNCNDKALDVLTEEIQKEHRRNVKES